MKDIKEIKSTSSDTDQHPRRASYAYRAVKAVEDVVRRMSSPVSMSHLEEHLEREIERDAQHPDRFIDIIRVSGEKILHTKKVLLLIVLLNIIDCALVLGELILDIHFVKGMVNIGKNLTISFVKQLKSSFPWLFHNVELSDVHIFYNKLLDLGEQIANSSSTANPFLYYNDTMSANREDVIVYTQNDLPKYLALRQGCSLEEDVAHAFHKCSISILGVLTLIFLDGIIVISSFVIDLVFIKGLIALPLEDAVGILAFLIPWRVVRVSNSLIMAVMDQGHLKLKMQYKEKKKIMKKLDHANNYNFYYKVS
ncbi:hypothetical protein FSP39_011377 [Pinctada imbricata]|uniref:Uncharacterized protein n=1 Tax=Pinctada imbricata TaxID=66713 RepID=A0AA88XIH8_PINIB|nr:hypothetical protein FSP39_011377 [Pinctada imbricata]